MWERSGSRCAEIFLHMRSHKKIKPMKYTAFILIAFISFCTTSLSAQEEFGMASYFSDEYQGRSTAYGDTYNKSEMTCAHKRHPYGSRLRVTRLDNNKSVIVKVIDKGPFIKGRIVDLSRKAAEQLGIIELGSVKVKLERIDNATSTSAKETATRELLPEERAPGLTTAKEEVVVERTAVAETPAPPTPKEEEKKVEVENTNTSVAETPAPVAEQEALVKTDNQEPQSTTATSRTANDRKRLVGKEYSPYGLYKFAIEKPEAGRYGVQVAMFTQLDNALQKIAYLQEKSFDNILVSMEASTAGQKQYRIILGPFGTQKEAQRYQQNLGSRYSIKGFVTDLDEIDY